MKRRFDSKKRNQKEWAATVNQPQTDRQRQADARKRDELNSKRDETVVSGSAKGKWFRINNDRRAKFNPNSYPCEHTVDFLFVNLFNNNIILAL